MQGLISLSRFIDGFTERVGKTVLWLVLAAVVISAINAIRSSNAAGCTSIVMRVVMPPSSWKMPTVSPFCSIL